MFRWCSLHENIHQSDITSADLLSFLTWKWSALVNLTSWSHPSRKGWIFRADNRERVYLTLAFRYFYLCAKLGKLFHCSSVWYSSVVLLLSCIFLWYLFVFMSRSSQNVDSAPLNDRKCGLVLQHKLDWKGSSCVFPCDTCKALTPEQSEQSVVFLSCTCRRFQGRKKTPEHSRHVSSRDGKQLVTGNAQKPGFER